MFFPSLGLTVAGELDAYLRGGWQCVTVKQ
jgi:hypothetical protein